MLSHPDPEHDAMTDSRLRRLRDRSTGPATLINEGCKISGLISGTGDYLINGSVDGDCDIEGTVTLAAKGLWAGTVRATTVIVSGHVEGDIVATGQIEITDTAKITGTVTGEAIAVAEGAIVDGVMKTTGQEKPVEFTEKRSEDK